MRELKQCIRQNPEQVNTWLRLINPARNIERVADHATNIAEAVVYLKEGDIIRHVGIVRRTPARGGRSTVKVAYFSPLPPSRSGIADMIQRYTAKAATTLPSLNGASASTPQTVEKS